MLDVYLILNMKKTKALLYALALAGCAGIPALAAPVETPGFLKYDTWFSSMPGPTWPNRLFAHAGSSAGLADSLGDFDSAGAVVLLHASCHNPTGADLSQSQWRELLALVRRRELIPFIDMAYQGLGEGTDADAFGLRLLCAELPEVLCAVSCSKNFGLYRERTGSLHVISASTSAADAALSQLVRIARGIWSMPPDHGAAIVQAILADEDLRRGWASEVEAMRRRIEELRLEVVQQLRRHCPQRDFGFIARQRGMFSFFGIDTAQVHALRERHHIYMTDDSRMNIAGLRRENLEYFVRAVAQVLSG